ncbi:MAG: SLC13 family permease, partial [Erysipelotrichia bacterium]|nr:SLC13 family permease [Erysipelotrichia bacterium]
MEKIIILSSFLVFIALLVSNRFKPVFLFTGLTIVYYLAGYLPESHFVSNFSNVALMTLVLLLLISIGLEKVHLITQIAPLVTKNSSERFALLKLSLITAACSAFLNNTAVVAMFMSSLKNQKYI